MSVDIKFTPDPNLEKRLEQAVEAGLISVAMAIEAQAVNSCPVDTGRLRGSITWKTKNSKDAVRGKAKIGDAVQQQAGKGEAVIGTNVFYASNMEYGSRPHALFAGEPKEGEEKGALTDWAKRKGIDAGFITVGKPHPFLRTGMDSVRPRATNIFEIAMKKVLG